MKTSPETPTTDLPGRPWQAAMADFRARAQRLFEAQRDRVEFLEACIAEQLAEFDQADDASPTPPADGSQDLPNGSPEELEHLRNQVAQSRKLLNARAGELKQLRSLLAEQADGVEEIDVEALLEQLSELRLERDELTGRLADAERLGQQSGVGDSEQFADLQRRFEVAVQEIRELKAKNDDLRQQAGRAEASSREEPLTTATGFDWEQQKLRLMQQLDSDFEAGGEDDKKTKLSIESTIRITDEVIAEKDRQIAELKALLEDNTVLSSEGAPSDVLDNDELIRQERERLSRLEEQWREKLRQAEIDISVERAKLARERSDFEAKLRTFEESGGDAPSGKPTPKQSGRWLSRLGLKDDDK